MGRQSNSSRIGAVLRHFPITGSQAQSSLLEEFSRQITGYFGGGRAFLSWKGRVSLYLILKALDPQSGDEVILPGYTCMVVPGPILYAGMTPRYVDIDPADFNMCPDLLDEAWSPRTRAIVVQHNFGIPARMQAILEWARRRNVVVIEDCCHAWGSRLGQRLCGTFGAASYFSGQWNKPFSTGLGGMLLVHDAQLADKIDAISRQIVQPPTLGQAHVLAWLMLVHHLAIFPRTTAMATRLFRFLSARNLVIGSSSPEEFTNQLTPGYARGMSTVQAAVGLYELSRIDRNTAHRRAVAAEYTHALAEAGWPTLRLPPDSDPVLVRYPVCVEDRPAVLAQAARAGVEIGTWFECPIHPIHDHLDVFRYTPGQCPVAEVVSSHMINLPTHLRVSPRVVRKTLQFLLKNCRPARMEALSAMPALRTPGRRAEASKSQE